MIFAHDTEASLICTAALVNTDLQDLTQLDQFVREHGYTGRRDRDAAELESVRKLRPQLRRFWKLGEAAIVTLVNNMLRDGRALPQLAKHDDWDYHLHNTAMDSPL